MKYTVQIGEITEIYEGTPQEILELKLQWERLTKAEVKSQFLFKEFESFKD